VNSAAEHETGTLLGAEGYGSITDAPSDLSFPKTQSASGLLVDLSRPFTAGFWDNAFPCQACFHRKFLRAQGAVDDFVAVGSTQEQSSPTRFNKGCRNLLNRKRLKTTHFEGIKGSDF
jgi:hypothetical protein